MAILGIGIDVVDVARMTASLARTPGLAERVFTSAERLTCAGDEKRLAARFAAKEAAAKALGVPDDGAWHDVEVINEETGRPRLKVTGPTAATAELLGVRIWHLSISHDGGVAAAMVIVEDRT